MLQDAGASSFIGGHPYLPIQTDIPLCRLCSAQQSFFFQVAFPTGHAWQTRTLAVFACTSCVDEAHLIPPMLAGALHRAHIPAEFLVDYQINFRFVVFATSTGVLRRDYVPRVAFRPLSIAPISDGPKARSKLGGTPDWLLEDESPARIGDAHPVHHLLQLQEDMEFPLLKDAPRQMELSLTGRAERSASDRYILLNGNRLYLFGVAGLPLVYCITQI